MCQGLNSHYFHIIGDGHQPNSRGLYTHYKDSLLKGGRFPIPTIATTLTMAHIKPIISGPLVRSYFPKKPKKRYKIHRQKTPHDDDSPSPETNLPSLKLMAKGPSQKETHLLTPVFQVQAVSFRKGPIPNFFRTSLALSATTAPEDTTFTSTSISAVPVFSNKNNGPRWADTSFWSPKIWGKMVILLMAEILHHLGCIKPCKQWDKLPTSTGDRRNSAINSPTSKWAKYILLPIVFSMEWRESSPNINGTRWGYFTPK